MEGALINAYHTFRIVCAESHVRSVPNLDYLVRRYEILKRPSGTKSEFTVNPVAVTIHSHPECQLRLCNERLLRGWLCRARRHRQCRRTGISHRGACGTRTT